MKALISIVAFLAQGVCLAAQMPKWVPSRHDVDDGTNVLVRLAVPFDIGTTCDKPEYGRPGKERTTGSCVEIVPAALYSFAKVICTISDDPACERTFVMRLTRYIDGPGWNNGRTYEAMCDTLVDFDAAEKRRVGDKWEVSFPVDMGMIEDLVHGDDRGTFCGKFGRYLDVDFLSRTIARRNPSADTRMMPDASHRSAVTVHGFVLERSSLDIEPKFVRPGNVFAAGERPGMKFRCTALRPGKHRMEWTICDAEGKSLKTGSAALPDDGETPVDLDVGRDGWHRVDFTVFDGSRVLLTHRASFVLLPPDTRTEGIGEGPYGTWTYGGAHHSSADIDFVGPLLERAGFRRAQGLRRYPKERRHAYKLSPEAVRWPGFPATTDVQRVEAIRRQIEDDPGCRSMLVFHECAPWGYQMAPEMTGQKWDAEKFGWFRGSSKPVDVVRDAETAKRLHALAMDQGRVVRANFPQITLTLGNSLGCTELVAEAIRNGLPEEYVDYMGLEAVVRNNLPERHWESSLLAGDLMLETAKAFGYGKWKVNACFESCYRIDALIGEDLQAAYYVRDLLICQAWRFPDIFIGVLCNTGNDYAGSFWGASGLCGRMPYAYPKKAYAAIAAATRLLDKVVGVRMLPTGDDCVYAVEYERADGKCVTALWAARGTADLALECVHGVKAEAFDFYGRSAKLGDTMTAGTFVRYIVSDGPALQKVAVVARAYPDDRRPDDAKTVEPASDVSRWRLAQGSDPLLDRAPGKFMPFRSRGEFALRQVHDEEGGDCLELELVRPNLSLPPMMWEYAVVELAQPIPLDGRPATIGMMVKGNSGWGQVGWVVEDPDGRRAVSLGRNANADVFDYQGDVSVDFTGWAYIDQLIDPKRSRVVDTSTGGGYVWNGASVDKAPLRLVGVAVAFNSRPLFLTERRAKRQSIRFRDVSTSDFASTNDKERKQP